VANHDHDALAGDQAADNAGDQAAGNAGDQSAGNAADQAADLGVRDEEARAQPGAAGPGGDAPAGEGPVSQAGAGELAEPGDDPAGQARGDGDAGTAEAAPPGRSAENAPYLPPGPNPFPSAYAPPPGEAAYEPQDGGYEDYEQDADSGWYNETGQPQQSYQDPPYAHPQPGQQSGPGYAADYHPGPYGQPAPVPPGYPQPPPGYRQTPAYQGSPPGRPGGPGPEMGPLPQAGVDPSAIGYPPPQPGYGGWQPGPGYPPPGGPEVLAPLPPHGAAGPRAPDTADSLATESLLRPRRPTPGSGWRRAVYLATAGLVRPGESQAERYRREMTARAATPVAGGHHRVAVMSLKGGVGKTTTTVGLGSVLASLRGDRVIAVDANPDRGTLSDKVRLETAATVRDLLNEREQIRRYADVRAFTTQAPSRLEVLASDRDPTVSVAFSEEDYYEVAQVLEYYYSICITDCGTGLLHSAMAGVLALADQIILVSSPSVDGARSANATLDWLDAHNYGDLVGNAVVVLSVIRPNSKSTVDVDRLEEHFAGRCRAVCRIPYDPYLEEGAEVELERLAPETANAYLALAAVVGDSFAWPRIVQRAAAN
jgi:MinD-like ATPase involved in chromosome partitioning or flagellar assembly